MNGYLLYDEKEAKRNEAFIDDLQKEAAARNMTLTLVTRVEEIPNDASFVFARIREGELIEQLENRGIRVFNRSEVVTLANDKFATMAFANELGIPTVPTERIESIGSITYPYPIVIKTTTGHGGREVYLCQSPEMVARTMEEYPEADWIAQPYIESNKSDVRVFVLGTEILGAIHRQGTKHSFKSNYTLGGAIEKFDVDEELRHYVETLATTLKSDYVGIDFLLPATGGYVLNEIEDPVGARSLYAYDVPVAAKILDYIVGSLA